MPPLLLEALRRLKLGVEPREAGSFGPAPRAGKGRAEWSFLEEQRKLCPFLEVDEAV